jgi:hypothetical protein
VFRHLPGEIQLIVKTYFQHSLLLFNHAGVKSYTDHFALLFTGLFSGNKAIIACTAAPGQLNLSPSFIFLQIQQAGHNPTKPRSAIPAFSSLQRGV